MTDSQPSQSTDAPILDRSTAPHSLIQIADIIGDDLAMALCREFGGTRLWSIPKQPNKRAHQFEETIGRVALEKLCKALGGLRVDIPRYHFRRLKKVAIIELAEAQPEMTRRQIARAVGCTEGYVTTTLRSLYPDIKRPLSDSAQSQAIG